MYFGLKTIVGGILITQLVGCLPSRTRQPKRFSKSVDLTVNVNGSQFDALSEKEFRNSSYKYKLEGCTSSLGTVLNDKIALKFGAKDLIAGKKGCLIRATSDAVPSNVEFEPGMQGTFWLSNSFTVANCEDGKNLCANINLYKKYSLKSLDARPTPQVDEYYDLRIHSVLKGPLDSNLFAGDYDARITCAAPLGRVITREVTVEEGVRPKILFKGIKVSKAINCTDLELRAYHKDDITQWTSFTVSFQQAFQPRANETINLFSEAKPIVYQNHGSSAEEPNENSINVNLKRCPEGQEVDRETLECK